MRNTTDMLKELKSELATENKEALPILNYLWVGTPRTNYLENKAPGSDVKDVLEMAKRCKNPICYYCLDEHVKNYANLFKDHPNILVKSIDSYLKEMKHHEDKEIRKSAKKMIEMKNELLNKPRDRIVDRVTFKDAFSLFLLSCEGGYTVDTGVKIQDGKDNVIFGPYPNFKMPHIFMMPECWMMYASPNQLEIPRIMLKNYLSKWDEVQNIIRGDLRKIDNLIKFHTKITALIIDSIECGLKSIKKTENPNDPDLLDPDWNFILDDVNGIAKLDKLSVVKAYGNTHKPEIECRQIVLEDIDNYFSKYFSDNRYRNALLKTLAHRLSEYEKLTDHQEIGKVNKELNAFLETVKALDRMIKAVSDSNEFYIPSSDDDIVKHEALFEMINTLLNNAYLELDNNLQNKQIVKNKIIENLKEKIDEILEEKDYFGIEMRRAVSEGSKFHNFPQGNTCLSSLEFKNFLFQDNSFLELQALVAKRHGTMREKYFVKLCESIINAKNDDWYNASKYNIKNPLFRLLHCSKLQDEKEKTILNQFNDTIERYKRHHTVQESITNTPSFIKMTNDIRLLNKLSTRAQIANAIGLGKRNLEKAWELFIDHVKEYEINPTLKTKEQMLESFSIVAIEINKRMEAEHAPVKKTINFFKSESVVDFNATDFLQDLKNINSIICNYDLHHGTTVSRQIEIELDPEEIELDPEEIDELDPEELDTSLKDFGY